MSTQATAYESAVRDMTQAAAEAELTHAPVRLAYWRIAAMDTLLESLGPRAPRIKVLDWHAEATSEKVAMGWHLDGRFSAVVGSHTHVPTADARVFPQGTAHVTDTGMVGPRDSVLGVDKDIIVARFKDGVPRRFEVAGGPVQFNSVIIDVDESSGRARSIERLDTLFEVE